tara:strand:+ start:11156 stop:12082 length:927 start_codon:yes stop_codon:yes gene_type:complete
MKTSNLNIKPKIFDCMKFIYSDLKEEELKTELFEDNEILYEIFKIKSKKQTSKILKKIIDKVYSINYVNLNIEILDYLGNVSSDISIINYGYGIIWLKEINPNLKLPKKFSKLLIKYLIEIANKNNDNIRYSNTESILILFFLNKIMEFKNLDNWIQNLCSKQKIDGRWTNGYNSYFINDIKLYDSYHTIISLIVLLEYQIFNEYNKIETKKENLKKNKNNVPILKNNVPILKNNISLKYKNQLPNIIEKFDNKKINFFDNKKINFFELEKVIKINNKYTLHYNLYNICFFIFIILSFFYISNPEFSV